MKNFNIKGEYIILNISEVLPNSWNPKDDIYENEENRLQFDMLKKTIKEKGFVDPIKVREIDQGYEIIDGYHRWLAQKEAGIDKIAAINLGKVDDLLAKTMTIDSEKIKVQINEVKLADLTGNILKELNGNIDEALRLLPMNHDQLLAYSEIADFDWDDYQAEILPDDNEGMEETEEEYKHGTIHKIIIKLKKQDFDLLGNHIKKQQEEIIKDLIEYIKSYL